jgi:hypothetical protein
MSILIICFGAVHKLLNSKRGRRGFELVLPLGKGVRVSKFYAGEEGDQTSFKIKLQNSWMTLSDFTSASVHLKYPENVLKYHLGISLSPQPTLSFYSNAICTFPVWMGRRI